MNKLDRGGQMHVKFAAITTHIRGGQCQHRTQAFAACLDQMGGDFGDARGMFGRHARADHVIDSSQVIGKRRCQLFMRFGRGVVQSHHTPVSPLDNRRAVPLSHPHETAFTHH